MSQSRPSWFSHTPVIQTGISLPDPSSLSRRKKSSSACDDWMALGDQRWLAAQSAERRDSVWAEPMERRLHQRLVRQLAKDSIEKLEVTCGRTVCRIKAHGTTMSSRAAFGQAVEATVEEPWTGLRIKGSTVDRHGDEWTQEYFVTHLPRSQVMA
jgi:hypothetical protein